MGTWGKKPFESDEALDLVDTINDLLMKSINKVNKASQRSGRYHYDKARAAAAMLVLMSREGNLVYYDSLSHAGDALGKMLKDKDWLSGWKSPQAARKQISKDLAEVDKELDRNFKTWKTP